MNDKFLYQNKIFKDRRKELRNNATKAEKILWEKLKQGKLGGHKFIRQYSVGPYILDFYCPKLRLAIELDGSQHEEQDSILYDKDRTDYLNTTYIKVLRFGNMEIVKNLNGSINKILNEALNGQTPS